MSCESKYLFKSQITENTQIAEGIYQIAFDCKEIASTATAGTFVNVKVPFDNSLILRRPFSIHKVEGDTVFIIFNVVGKGTKALSEAKIGTELDVLGPLGQGFTIEDKPAYLVGGGCGTPPLYFLAKKLKEKDLPIHSFLGFSSKEKTILTDDFNKISLKSCHSTDDGSSGDKGTVIDLLKNINVDGVIYACGPHKFLGALKEFCVERGIKAQVSLEERMGCGFGVCLGCAVKTTDGSFKYVCKDGPVFDINDVDFD